MKDSSNYGLFICEDTLGADTWLATHDHIKEVDWTLGTEGTDCIFLPYAGDIRLTPNFNIQIIDFFQGAGVDITLGTGYWLFTIQGRYGGATETIRNTKMENMTKLFNNHLRLDKNTLYLGYRMRGEVWFPFINSADAVKYYLKGKLLNAEPWRAANQNYYNWKIAFRGVW